MLTRFCSFIIPVALLLGCTKQSSQQSAQEILETFVKAPKLAIVVATRPGDTGKFVVAKKADDCDCLTAEIYGVGGNIIEKQVGGYQVVTSLVKGNISALHGLEVVKPGDPTYKKYMDCLTNQQGASVLLNCR